MHSVVHRKVVSRTFLYAGLVTIAVMWLLPVFFIVMTALKSNADIMTRGLFALPQQIQWGNFIESWTVGKMSVYFTNSVFVCFISVPICAFLSLLNAFAISRMNFKYGRALYFIMVVGMMIPIYAIIIPQVMEMQLLNLLSSHVGIIIAYVTGGIPYCTFLMTGYLKSIPMDIDESAKIDGCSDFRRFIMIIIPLAIPIIATVCILEFLANWNDYLYALLLLRTENLRTLPLGLVNYSDRFKVQYHLLTMGVLISTIPVTLVYISLQKFFISGLAAGAVKG